ncbi:MAG TPA: VOC family protein [Thermoplasmata archaeon]|nr:VOC family protein [Thermoplasmata archaeon]
MAGPGRPGPKPKRLYVRVVRWGETERDDQPAPSAVRAFLSELNRVGRLAAAGALTAPPGHLVVLRAADAAEATRILRGDPYAGVAGSGYEILEWDPSSLGVGVNLEPAPGRGSGRLTQLQRVTVVVRDQTAARRWYTEVLGLALRAADPDTGYLELALGKGAAALSLVAPSSAWGEPYYSEAMARLGVRTGIAFETDSVAALALRLEHARARVTQAAERQPWGGSAIRFTDPDGNEFLAFDRSEGRPTAAAAGRTAARPRKRL